MIWSIGFILAGIISTVYGFVSVSREKKSILSVWDSGGTLVVSRPNWKVSIKIGAVLIVVGYAVFVFGMFDIAAHWL